MVDAFHFYRVVLRVEKWFEDGFSDVDKCVERSSDLSFFGRRVFFLAIIPTYKTYWNGLYDSPCEGRSSLPVFTVISLDDDVVLLFVLFRAYYVFSWHTDSLRTMIHSRTTSRPLFDATNDAMMAPSHQLWHGFSLFSWLHEQCRLPHQKSDHIKKVTPKEMMISWSHN